MHGPRRIEGIAPMNLAPRGRYPDWRASWEVGGVGWCEADVKDRRRRVRQFIAVDGIVRFLNGVKTNHQLNKLNTGYIDEFLNTPHTLNPPLLKHLQGIWKA